METKRVSVALHYRLAPHLESLCHDTLVRAMREVDGVELLRGKCVFEVKPRGVHKGQAIIDFMTQPPLRAARRSLWAMTSPTRPALPLCSRWAAGASRWAKGPPWHNTAA